MYKLSPYLSVESLTTMRFSFLAIAMVALCSSSPGVSTTDAFAPVNRAFHSGSRLSLAASTATSGVVEVPTTPIPGMKPGTSGLRKKVEIWQGVEEVNKYYVENFIQSLLDTATANNEGVMPHTYVSFLQMQLSCIVLCCVVLSCTLDR
jgi:phosphoglucomutase